MSQQLTQLLEKFDQKHLLYASKINPSLARELLSCFEELNNFYPLSFEKANQPIENLNPFTKPLRFQPPLKSQVSSHLAQRKIACVILAGGDGSRLGSSLPKGCFPFSYNNQTLFEIFCGRLLSLENKINIPIPLIILTSKNNNAQTVEFFEKHQYFGLKKDYVEFIIQPHLPFFYRGKAFLKKNGSLASGPNGNGIIFRLLKNIMISHPQIETFQIINVDNPLAYPIDLELLETHLQLGNDITLRCIPISNAHQNIGRLYQQNHELFIQDYTDEPSSQKASFGSINIFAFSKAFILSLCQENLLPLHWVKKQILHQKDQAEDPSIFSYLKGELFITDALKYAAKASCILTEAKNYFAPLKSLEGPGSLKEAQEALQNKEATLNKKSQPFDFNLYYSAVDIQKII